MANYSVLKAAVQAVVKTNGNQEITGANMQSTLISIINSLGTGYQFMGVATPSTSPGTPDYNVAYIGGAGTYANFGTSVTVPVGSVGVFKYNGSWTKENFAVYTRKDTGILNLQAYIDAGGIELEQGGILIDTGANGASATAVRMVNALPTEGLYVAVPDGYVIHQVFYYTEWTDNTSFTYSKAYTPVADYYTFDTSYPYVRFTIKRASFANLTLSDFLSTLQLTKNKFDDIAAALGGITINKITTTIGIEYKYVQRNGTLASSNNYYVTNPIQVIAGDYVIVNCLANTGAVVISECDENLTSFTPVVNAVTGTRQYSYLFENDKYIAISYMFAYPFDVTIYRAGITSRNMLDIATLNTNVYQLKYHPTYPFVDFGGNLFNRFGEIVSNSYILSGNITPTTNGYSVSDYIYIEEGKTYTLKCYPGFFGSANAKYISAFNGNKQYLRNIVGEVDGDTLTFSVPANQNISLCRITVANADFTTFMMVEGSTYPSSYKSCQWVTNDLFLMSSLNTSNNLYGKKAAYDGDSIAAGQASTSLKGWSPIIADRNSMSYNSIAVGGATITYGTQTSGGGNRHWICEGVETIYNSGFDPDYIIFEGGTNDADIIGSILNGNVPANFGSWSPSGYTGTFDKTTFCGAVEYMFQKALTLFPHKKFGFIIAQKMGRTSNYSETANNRRAYFGVIMQICKKWGVPYINLWDDGFLCPSIQTHYDNTLDVEGNIAAGSLYTDGQHLTLNGYNSVSSKIEAWMRTL